jgi:DNA mismatch repair protein MutS
MPAQAPKTLPCVPQSEEDVKVPDAVDPSESSDGCRTRSTPDFEQYASLKPFQSILFLGSDADIPVDGRSVPEVFPDLLLDQVIASITTGRDEYNLEPYFYSPLGSVEAVLYRHEVLQDLENPAVSDTIQSFAQSMRNVRNRLGQMEKLHYDRQKQSWFLDAIEIYCEAVRLLSHDLTHTSLCSQGFRSFRGFLASYIESKEFVALAADTTKLRVDLKQVTYSIHIDGRRVTATRYEPAPDYGADVLETFEKFSQGAAKQYNFKFHADSYMNHVESAILDLVARIYPETFSFLEEYGIRHKDYLNCTIARFDREIQFYLACRDHVQRLKRAGLLFCYPVVSDESKAVAAKEVFDIALADKLVSEGSLPVTNNFYLTGKERILVVSGPNQGGKTTFARTFGQLHYLASLGCPVPGRDAKLFLFDRLFTHFEEEEDIQNRSGKLENELLRIHRILECATPNSILIMNESFLSTTLNDALFLSRKIMEQIVTLDLLCITVTFLDELATFSESTASMVSTVNSEDPALRTFKVIRKPADGLAYAAAIAEKYGLTYRNVRSRIARNTSGRIAP